MPIRTTERNARELLKPRARNRSEVLSREAPLRKRRLGLGHKRGIDVFQHRRQTVLVKAKQSIADETGDPDAGVLVERKAIREIRGRQLQDGFARSEFVAGTN